MRIITLLPLLLASSLALPAAQSEPDETLDIYLIDVEGGEATLFVSPAGESLLVDAGWPGLEYRDADRIAAVAREAGVTQIDYLLVTHFHTDHMGGAMQLAERLPIRHFIDHGETVDTGERQRAAFGVYTALRSQGVHRAVAPGDTLPMDGLDVVIMASGGEVLDCAARRRRRPQSVLRRLHVPGRGDHQPLRQRRGRPVHRHVRRLRAVPQRHHGRPELEPGAPADVPGQQDRQGRPVPGVAPRLGDVRLRGARPCRGPR